MRTPGIAATSLFFFLLGCIVGWITTNKLDKGISTLAPSRPLYDLVGKSTESDDFKRLSVSLDLKIVEPDQYVFLPRIWIYRETAEEGDIKRSSLVFYSSKCVPVVIKAYRSMGGEQTIAEISIGQYNITGDKLTIDSKVLELLDFKIHDAGFYIPYDFILVGGVDDAKRLLFYPYSTIVEEKYPEGRRIMQPSSQEPVKYPVAVWHESDKVFSINLWGRSLGSVPAVKD